MLGPVIGSRRADAASLASVLQAPLPEDTFAALDAARFRTWVLFGDLTDPQLERQVSTLQSPLAWDLAHIAAHEDLWLAHRSLGLPLLRPDMTGVYDAFKTPRASRANVDRLTAPEASDCLTEVRRRISDRAALDGRTEAVEMVLRHELQHTETMLQTLALTGLDGGLKPHPLRRPIAERDSGLVAIAGGEASIGSRGRRSHTTTSGPVTPARYSRS